MKRAWIFSGLLLMLAGGVAFAADPAADPPKKHASAKPAPPKTAAPAPAPAAAKDAPISLALAACGAGSLTCSNDTTNQGLLRLAIVDPATQQRVLYLWLQQCQFIYSETATTAGHAQRVIYCQKIADGLVSPAQMVALIMNSTVSSQILNGTPPAGNMVDADVNSAIGAAMTATVSGGSAGSAVSPTATAASGSQTLTVSSGSGIVVGQQVIGAGIPVGTSVIFVSGTTVYLNTATTAALSATPVTFISSATPPVVSGLPH